jgi:hypothetical protein
MLDVAKAILPYANLFMNTYGTFGFSSKKQSPSYHVEGANNIMNVTHENNSRNTSNAYEDSMNSFWESPIESNVSTETSTGI